MTPRPRPRRLASASLTLLLAAAPWMGGCASSGHSSGASASAAPVTGPDAELPYRLEVERVVGTYGAGAGQMAYPEGVAVDDLGRIFVADTGNNRVERFDPAGVFLGEFGGFGFEEGRFDKPRDLFIGGGLNLWVLDGENNRVVRYDLDGQLQGIFVDFDTDDARLALGAVRPSGLAGEATGYLYVSDETSDRLIVLNPLAGAWSPVGGFGSQPGRFRHPTGLAVSLRGTVYVGDGGNGRVQALDSFGGFLRAYPLGEPNTLGRVGVCVLPGGAVVACESEASRLSVFTADGKLLARLSQHGSRPGQLDGPSALAVDRTGRLYVADTRNHRIQIFHLVDRSAPAPSH